LSNQTKSYRTHDVFLEAQITADVDLIERRAGRLAGCGIRVTNAAIGYAKFYSRSHDAVIRVRDAAGAVIETHEHTGDFKEFSLPFSKSYVATSQQKGPENFAWPTALLIAFGSAYPKRPNGSTWEIKSKPRCVGYQSPFSP